MKPRIIWWVLGTGAALAAGCDRGREQAQELKELKQTAEREAEAAKEAASRQGETLRNEAAKLSAKLSQDAGSADKSNHRNTRNTDAVTGSDDRPTNRTALPPLGKPDDGSLLTSSEIREYQSRLKEEGLLEGKADGIIGTSTRRAIAAYQGKHGLEQTGRLDAITRESLSQKAGAAGID